MQQPKLLKAIRSISNDKRDSPTKDFCRLFRDYLKEPCKMPIDILNDIHVKCLLMSLKCTPKQSTGNLFNLSMYIKKFQTLHKHKQ